MLANLCSHTFTFGEHWLDLGVVWIVILGGRNTGDGLILEGQILDGIGSFDSSVSTELLKDVGHDLLEVLAILNFIIVWIILWQDFVKEDAAKGSITLLTLRVNTNWSLKLNETHIIGKLCLINASIGFALGLCRWFFVGEVVATKYDVLRNREHWCTIGWLQEVLAGSHEFLSLSLSFGREWKVNRHLVTIVVGVEAVCDEWMKLDSFTVDQTWLEGLDRETVEGWSTVQKNILTLNDFV